MLVSVCYIKPSDFNLSPNTSTNNEFDWILKDNILVKYSINDIKKIVVVPKGFNTDLASVPKLLWNIIPPFGNHTRASIVHDYMYRNGIEKRSVCDKLFLSIMIYDGVSKIKAYSMYYAVRIFGWKFYGKK